MGVLDNNHLLDLIPVLQVHNPHNILPDNFFNGFNVIRLLAGNFISGNVISNGEGTVIAEESNEEAIDKLNKSGMQVHALNLSEFLKGTGGPSCLILPVTQD